MKEIDIHEDHLPIKHPRINGRAYRPRADKVLITKANRNSPPEDWHISTPNPTDETGETRWYWLFLVAGLIGLALLYLYQLGVLDETLQQLL